MLHQSTTIQQHQHLIICFLLFIPLLLILLFFFWYTIVSSWKDVSSAILTSQHALPIMVRLKCSPDSWIMLMLVLIMPFNQATQVLTSSFPNWFLFKIRPIYLNRLYLISLISSQLTSVSWRTVSSVLLSAHGTLCIFPRNYIFTAIWCFLACLFFDHVSQVTISLLWMSHCLQCPNAYPHGSLQVTF